MNYTYLALGGFLIVGVFSAFCSFLFEKHLLSLLMSLEMIVVIIYMNIAVGGVYYISLFYLVMGVCEGAVGISLLVSMSRSSGSGYLASYNLGRW